jgi:hypothetical protein
MIAIMVAFIPREPKYDERTLSEWIKDSAPRLSPDPEQTRAIEAVRHIGTNGLPWLIKWTGHKDKPALFKPKSLPAWIPSGISTYIFENVSGQGCRQLAYDGFHILGEEARPAVPDLLRMAAASPEYLVDHDAFSERGFEGRYLPALPAFAALESIGWEIVFPQMLDALTNHTTSLAVKTIAASWLTQLEPAIEKQTVVSVLASAFRNDSSLRPVAAQMLARHGAKPDLLVPFLVNGLYSQKAQVRLDAIFALRHYGRDATAAVASLINLLHDPDLRVQQMAEECLLAMGPEPLEKAAEPFVTERIKKWRRMAEEFASPVK